jgi:hypothetical protein
MLDFNQSPAFDDVDTVAVDSDLDFPIASGIVSLEVFVE